MADYTYSITFPVNTAYEGNAVQVLVKDVTDTTIDTIAAGTVPASGRVRVEVTVEDDSENLSVDLVRVSDGLYLGYSSFDRREIAALNGEALDLNEVESELAALRARLAEQVPGEDAVVVIEAPSDPSLCRVVGYLYKPNGQPAHRAEVRLSLTVEGAAKSGGNILLGRSVAARTDANGLLDVTVERNDTITPAGTTWRIRCEAADLDESVALDEATFNPATLIT